MSSFISWHKKYINWWGKKLNISDYGMLWVAFIKGVIIGLLIYHFLLNSEIRSFKRNNKKKRK